MLRALGQINKKVHHLPMHAFRARKKSIGTDCFRGRRRNWRQRSERASWSNYLLFPPLAFPLDNLLLFCSAANDTKTDFRKREGGWSVLMIFQVSADPCYYSPFPPSFFWRRPPKWRQGGRILWDSTCQSRTPIPPPSNGGMGSFSRPSLAPELSLFLLLLLPFPENVPARRSLQPVRWAFAV